MSDTSAALTVTCRDDADGTLVAVRGELDIASVGQLQAAIIERQPLRGRLRLDLSEVTFFDSSAVRTVLEARRIALEDTGRTIELVAASHAVRRVLDMAGASDVFD